MIDPNTMSPATALLYCQGQSLILSGRLAVGVAELFHAADQTPDVQTRCLRTAALADQFEPRALAALAEAASWPPDCVQAVADDVQRFRTMLAEIRGLNVFVMDQLALLRDARRDDDAGEEWKGAPEAGP